MSLTDCIFCSKKGNKSKEHVWPRWLQNKMYGSTKWMHHGTHFSSTGNIISQRSHSGESLVLGAVCEKCNTGWMNNLESAFMPILEKIEIDSNAIKSLSKEEVRSLCLWIFKTTLVINASTNYRKIIPIEHYKFLYKNKKIPRGVRIDTSYINEFKELNWNQTQAMIIFPLPGVKEVPEYILRNDNKYNIAIQIGNFAARTFWIRGNKGHKHELENRLENIRLFPSSGKKLKRNAYPNYKNLIEFTASATINLLE